MACKGRGCEGVPLCSATDIAGIQFNLTEECPTDDCNGIPEGFSIVSVQANGLLQVCSFPVGEVCSCVPTAGGAEDSLVDNNDGTFTHTSNAGTPQIFDVCNALQFCTIGQLGNVSPLMDNPFDYDQTIWNELTQLWEPVRNVGPAILCFDNALGQTQALVQGVTTPIDFPCIRSDPLGELTTGPGASFTPNRTGCYDVRGSILLESLGAVPDGNIALFTVNINGVQSQTFDWAFHVEPGTGAVRDGLHQYSSSQTLCLTAGDVVTFNYIQLAWATGQMRGPDTFIEFHYISGP